MNDDRLRTALHELGDVMPPPDLAGSALTRARRDRRRTVAGLVALLAATAVTVPALVLGHAAPAETGVAARSHAVVAGFAGWDPKTGANDYWAYDGSSGRYVRTPWRSAVPSPDGRLVLVSEWNSQKIDHVGIVAADRVLDRTAVRWISDGRFHPGQVPPGDGPGVWSPDSSRVLLMAFVTTGAGPRTEWHVVVFDARTLAAREVALAPPAGGLVVTLGSTRVVFGPHGKGFAFLTPGVLALFDEQGRATGQVPVGKAVMHDQPFSADGRLVAVYSVGPSGGYSQMLTVAGGGEVGRADGDAVGWVDDRHCVVQVGRSARVVEIPSGRVVAERQLAPAGRQLTGVWLAPLDGAAPPGAVVL